MAAAPGQPEPWQLYFQEAASPVMDRITDLNTLLTWLSVVIVLLVAGLMGYAMWRFSAKRNPTPSTRSHHRTLEITWTVIPVLILIAIAFPSFRLLYFMDKVPEADMTLKAVGHQWYWSYEYPDHQDLNFDAFMAYEEDLKEGQPRLLQTDRPVVLPVDTTIKVLVTSSDVIHSWAVPALGVKIDAVPGRLNETWVRIEEPGMYYGQCSELCGINHAFMPVAIKAVPKQQFAAWVEETQREFAAGDGPATRVARKD